MRLRKILLFMVILGNPPYSGHSANVGDWIKDLLRGLDSTSKKKTHNYFEVDGGSLGERNPKWLNDDYVKFIRFAQWRIEQTGYGILAFITNHGYLDNPTFRGMRQCLMETFDDIYILDLHGNAKKKEICPDGSKDENVFDIQQGVSIGIFVKKFVAPSLVTPTSRRQKGSQQDTGATRESSRQDVGVTRIYHSEIWGLRELVDEHNKLIGGKYHWLYENELKTTKWTELKPQSPFYLFVPQNIDLKSEYDIGWKITDVMPLNSVGIVTARDHLTIRWSKEEIWKIVKDFVSLSVEEAREKYSLGKDVRDWKVSLAQDDINKHKVNEKYIKKILYRPFDFRYTYYTGQTRGFICMPRPAVMRNMIEGDNIGLIARRQMLPTRPSDYFFISKFIISDGVIRSDNHGSESLFPLYLYPPKDLVENDKAVGGRKANISEGFIRVFSERLNLNFIPEGKGSITSIADKMSALHSCNADVPSANRIVPSTNDGNTDILSANGNSIDLSSALSIASHLHYGEVSTRSRGRLPHWELESGIYFITFRLADSLPKSVLEEIDAERERLKKRILEQKNELTPLEKSSIAEMFSDRIQAYLDKGIGSCYLSNPQVADVVRDSLFYFDGQRYKLFAWCVMPNHIHLLLAPVPNWSLQDIMHSIKSYTSKKANQIIGQTGMFWQKEYYDHIVRDENEFENTFEYILGNPERAGLKDWNWVGIGKIIADETSALQKPQELADKMSALQKLTFGPEDLFNYIYAIFYSQSYRKRYTEFLKIDFPRVPLTSNIELFRELCILGEELVSLHLIDKFGQDITSFPVKLSDNDSDNCVVEKVTYTEPTNNEKGKVWINKKQYFEGVPQDVWEFRIGGYQVCEKWLKDRKGRKLTFDDITHYQHIVSALSETIRIMGKIDEVIDKHGGWPII